MHGNEHSENERKRLRTDEDMLKKILIRECGNDETDEYAADELELRGDGYEAYEEDAQEFGEDGIGESNYFSTCEYTMIPTDDDSVNCQGS